MEVRGLITAVAFLDIKKAFDSVSHELLLQKLADIGAEQTTLLWFYSYLIDRQHSVCIGTEQLGFLPLTSGVPQGSVLGSLLFLLYLNVLLKSSELFPDVFVDSFADDTTIDTSGKTRKEAVDRLNNALQFLQNWLNEHRLPINAQKRKAILITSQRPRGKCINDGSTPIMLNGEELEEVASICHLGVKFNHNLTWAEQFQSVARSMN